MPFKTAIRPCKNFGLIFWKDAKGISRRLRLQSLRHPLLLPEKNSQSMVDISYHLYISNALLSFHALAFSHVTCQNMPCFSSLLLWLPSVTGAQEVSFAAAITACGRSTRWHVASGTWHRWSSNRFIPMKVQEALANVKYVNVSWVMTWKSLRLKLFEEVYTASRASLTCFSAAASWLLLSWFFAEMVCFSTQLVPVSCAQKHVNIVMWRSTRCDSQVYSGISFKVSVHGEWQIESLHVYTYFHNAFIARAYMSYSLIAFVSFCFFAVSFQHLRS